MNKQTVGKFNQNASLKKSIVAFLLAAALLVSMVGMASAQDVITFYLDSSEGAASGIYKMWQNDYSSISGNVEISAGGSAIWTANASAQYDAAFPAGKDWNGNIRRTTTSSDQNFTATIGYYDGSDYHWDGGTAEITIESGEPARTFVFDGSAFTVPEGSWLAYKVESSTGMTINTHTGGVPGSWIYYVTPPEYPVPELPTIILMSTGLLALAGFVVYSRSRRRNGKAQ